MLEPLYPIPSKINAYLEYNGYNKAKVARRIGISPNEFYEMLMLRKTMTADIFVRLCTVLGRTAGYFTSYQINDKFEAS